MDRTLAWLETHGFWTGTISIVYSLAVILPHDLIQNPALAAQAKYGMVPWHFGILSLIGIAAGTSVWFALKSHERRLQVWSARYRFLTAGAVVVVASTTLMVNSVEHIHYVQYGVLALFLAPLLGNTTMAVIVAALIGAVDEGYQYFVLHPWQPYFDFNDVVLNAIGATSAGIIYDSFAVGSPGKTPAVRDRNLALGWGAFFAVVLLLFATDVLGPFADTGRIVLNRHPRPDAFGFAQRWIDTGWGNHWFQLSPTEGLLILFCLPLLLLINPRSRRCLRGEDVES